MTKLADKLKFTKVEAGWYATEDGTLAIVSDGYEPVAQRDRDGQGVSAGVVGGEWALVKGTGLREDAGAGENLEWFGTKGEAVKAAQRL